MVGYGEDDTQAPPKRSLGGVRRTIPTMLESGKARRGYYVILFDIRRRQIPGSVQQTHLRCCRYRLCDGANRRIIGIELFFNTTEKEVQPTKKDIILELLLLQRWQEIDRQ